MSSDGADARLRLERPVEIAVTPARLERGLWVLVALSLVGDIATTFVGLHLGLTESNPVANSAIDGYGLGGMLALKAAAVGVGLACRPLLPRPYRSIVPAGLALPWTVATMLNLALIATVV
ncbi:hypothetical protein CHINAEXTREME_19275 [Halobiforma lacisalsi AJ5]|uniref:DUF5658 domain-containing protein n=1 Tax=Natronobacterium lacisalsi AJ5 TaxID=358396 RepID=M0LSE4_NATLA|nr:DUF5658 family protein [Halobiforma lacisalsi]APW99779.1 hypothetical protein CHINAEXTREME_19275 [Halobiforma lacisalsi AJ5]EMA36043.1 hypothetical protein C445_04278 [Halobiforma lacisalsi AJ5]